MTTNPFDSGVGEWLVVINGEGQFALWRTFLELPEGWQTASSAADRDSALEYVERNWIGGPGPTSSAAAR